MVYDILLSSIYLFVFCIFLMFFHHVKYDIFFIMFGFFGVFTLSVVTVGLDSYYILLFFVFLIIALLLSFKIMKLKITSYVLATLFIGLLFIISCNVFTFVMAQFVINISFEELYYNKELCLIIKTLAILLYVVSIINYLYFIKSKKVKFIDIKVTSFVFIELTMLLAIFTLAWYLFIRDDFYISLTLLFLIFAFVGIIYLYYQIQILEQKELKLVLEKQKEFNTSVTYHKIHQLREEIAEMEHALTVVLLDIKEHSDSYDVDVLVDNYIQNLSKYSSLFITDNPFFDVAMTTKLNELMQSGRFCKIGIFISCDEFYDNLEFVTLMCDILERMDKICIYNTDIDLSMIEKNQFTVIKVMATCSKSMIHGDFSFIQDKVHNLNGKCQIEIEEDISISMSFNRNDAPVLFL
ncbi:hypothetical protein [Tannockella kyphosi]|uniref:hypothetical protein n=1 Tax=Tannockella kyphosi TaxID=2899121 RepID=UPI002010E1B2|nr:hypothetical protein [Tannockella kyphosi]